MELACGSKPGLPALPKAAAAEGADWRRPFLCLAGSLLALREDWRRTPETSLAMKGPASPRWCVGEEVLANTAGGASKDDGGGDPAVGDAN